MYTGFTTNIEERIKNHNDGKSKSTAPRRPLELIFPSFIFLKLMRENVKCILKQQLVKRQSS